MADFQSIWNFGYIERRFVMLEVGVSAAEIFNA
jgi:hypothetical protein